MIGTQIYNPRTGEFTVKQGPVFANVVLADEINRAPAKVQSALLEAMAERQVTIGEIVAPAAAAVLRAGDAEPDRAGRHVSRCPEAQVDRFMLKVVIDYPSRGDELAVLDRMGGLTATTDIDAGAGAGRPGGVASGGGLGIRRSEGEGVHRRRGPGDAQAGGVRPGPDGPDSTGREHAGGDRAATGRRRPTRSSPAAAYVTPEDVKATATDVLRHRLVISFEAEAEDLRPDQLVKQVLDKLPVP